MIKHELKTRYKGIIIWSICMALLIYVSMLKGDAFISDPEAGSIFETLPSIISALFGFTSIDIATPFGYYSILYIYIAIALAIHGVMVSVNIFANEDIDHTYEYLLTKPVKRSHVFVSKVVVSMVIILIVNVVTMLAGLVTLRDYFATYPDLLNQVLILSLNIYLFVIICVSISYLIMAIIKKPRLSASLSMGVILLFYILNVVATVYPDNNLFYYLTPMQFLGPEDVYYATLWYPAYAIVVILFVIAIVVNFLYFKNREIT